MYKKIVLLSITLVCFALCLEYTFTTALTTPSNTEALTTYENNMFLTDHLFQYTLTGVSNNVVLKFEGSLDNSSWFNLDDNEAVVTKDANGTYQSHKSSTPLKYVRSTMVSESGATTATVNVKYLGVHK